MYFELMKLIKLANYLDSEGRVGEADKVDERINKISSFLDNYNEKDIPDSLKSRIKLSKKVMNNYLRKTAQSYTSPSEETILEGSKYNINPMAWVTDPDGADGKVFEVYVDFLRMRANNKRVSYKKVNEAVSQVAKNYPLDSQHSHSISSVTPADAKEMLLGLSISLTVGDEIEDEERSAFRNRRKGFVGMPYSSYANLMGSVLHGKDFNKEFKGVDEKQLLPELMRRSRPFLKVSGERYSKGDDSLASELTDYAEDAFFDKIIMGRREGYPEFDQWYENGTKVDNISDFSIIPAMFSRYTGISARHSRTINHLKKMKPVLSDIDRSIVSGKDYYVKILADSLDEASANVESGEELSQYVMKNWDMTDMTKSPFYTENMSETHRNLLQSWFRPQHVNKEMASPQYKYASLVQKIIDWQSTLSEDDEDYIHWINDSKNKQKIMNTFVDTGMLFKFVENFEKVSEKVNENKMMKSLEEKAKIQLAKHEEGEIPVIDVDQDRELYEMFNNYFDPVRILLNNDTGELAIRQDYKEIEKRRRNIQYNALVDIARHIDVDYKVDNNLIPATESENGLQSLKERAALKAMDLATDYKMSRMPMETRFDENVLYRDESFPIRSMDEEEGQMEELNVQKSNFYNKDALFDNLDKDIEEIKVNSFISYLLKKLGEKADDYNVGGRKGLNLSDRNQREKYFPLIKSLFNDYIESQEFKLERL